MYCFTHADWWVNLIGGKQVGLLIGGQEYTGEAVPIREDKEKMIAGLGKLLTAVPNDMRYYNVSTDAQGNLNQAELECAVDEATMIEITLAGPDA